jgi:release factor glutamine methyltransferase
MLNDNDIQFNDASAADLSVITEIINECITIADALSASRKLLAEHQENLTFNEPILEASIFVEQAFDKTSMQLITQSGEKLCDSAKKALSTMLSKRISGVPVAYIVGHQPFWTLNLKVSEQTLIPRADSEIIVETAVSLLLVKDASILDLGTGTGAIALAIKSECPQWSVTGCDFKSEIVELANANARLNQLKVDFFLSDWFSAVPETKRFDLIVSNPPYIEASSSWLQQGDVRFEPDSALTSGVDGLDDIRHIILRASQFLNAAGYLLLEHGHEQAEVIQELLHEAGYKEVTTNKDLSGLDRATLGRWMF